MFPNDDTFPCEFLHDTYEEVKEMMRNNPDMSKDTRDVILYEFGLMDLRLIMSKRILNSIVFKCLH